jgi:hypothetical protein
LQLTSNFHKFTESNQAAKFSKGKEEKLDIKAQTDAVRAMPQYVRYCTDAAAAKIASAAG